MSDAEKKAPARPEGAALTARRPARGAAAQMQGESAPPRQAGGQSAGQAEAPLQIRDWAAF